ncbi:MAG: hypothetical protein A2Z15_06465 [Chloroflexi bacterium RBG_16_50_11]|nr:MAG: hypothetical protein A2Z15_06465 [Chloroflexi bacterium RBG_16_50_11]
MYDCIYYTRPTGRQPAVKFRDEQPANIRAEIDAKIRKLQENGVDILLKTSMVKWLGPKALYELRNRQLGWRIAFYVDKLINKYILLYGWKKQRDSQPSDVKQARVLLDEYLCGRN